MSNSKQELETRVRELEATIAELQERIRWPVTGETVRVPERFQSVFDAAQETVKKFFSQTITDPTRATIKISGERYVLLRASSLSVDFLTTIKNLYSDYGEDEAFAIGRNFLFDISHVIGMEDAKNFHKKMKITDPIAKLSAGPVHFAYSGWAFVDISSESTPSPDDDYFLKYDHPFSFEADSWIKAGRQSSQPVCIMNSGYSSGWCEESYGMPLTAVELTCKAAGDKMCTFIMAPPHKIQQHVGRFVSDQNSRRTSLQIPSFFERKRVEEEMKTARSKAEESDRLKSQFLANMSHEIRTPMNGVIGMTELVLETELTDVQREYVSTIRESAESLMEIINQVLDFSKIEAEAIVLDLQPFELRKSLAEVMKPFLLSGESSGIKVEWNVAKDVPDRLIGDVGRVRQVIVNLVGNALKFTVEGNIGLEVTREENNGRPDHVSIHFAVRDSGIGIPQEKLETIFDAFNQVDMSTTRRYGGTGLGLTISCELIRLMNGRIWCENNEQSPGSSFHFVMDFELDHDDVVADQAQDFAKINNVVAAADDEIANRIVRGINILVAEDGLVNQKLANALLKKWGHSVTIVNNGREAVNTWQESPSKFDLILMDVLMPELDGLEATEAIRQVERRIESHIPIVAITAQVLKDDREACLKAGMDDYISKPIRQHELQRVIDRLIG